MKVVNKLLSVLFIDNRIVYYFISQNHAIVVMEALGAAVESLDDSEQLTLVLYALGRTHRDYCVTPAMLKVMVSLK